MMAGPADVLDFWFLAAARERWFGSTPEFDEVVRSRFEHVWTQAREHALIDWEESQDGALALVIVLDQFPLNMFRDDGKRHSTEAQSREVAGRAIARGFDQRLPHDRLAFLYLPDMHSESLADQDRSVELFEGAGLDANLGFARHHREIVRRFGRFPHRNQALGRDSTPEEIEWLASPEAFRP